MPVGVKGVYLPDSWGGLVPMVGRARSPHIQVVPYMQSRRKISEKLLLKRKKIARQISFVLAREAQRFSTCSAQRDLRTTGEAVGPWGSRAVYQPPGRASAATPSRKSAPAEKQVPEISAAPAEGRFSSLKRSKYDSETATADVPGEIRKNDSRSLHETRPSLRGRGTRGKGGSNL